MRPHLWSGLLVCACLLGAAFGAPAEVAFPGPDPGPATATNRDGVFLLQNAVVGAAWRETNGQWEPAWLENRLTGVRWDQTGAELFRLASRPALAHSGLVVGVRLESDRVVALASKDGQSWTELAAFPRAEFPGEPMLARLGKMNLHALARDNPGDLGALGHSVISEFSLAPAGEGRYEFTARAHAASARSFTVPPGTRLITCRIEKDTDQGLSWGPALALVWEEGRRFLLIGVREPKAVFNVTTARGEAILGGRVDDYADLDWSAADFRLAGPPRLAALPPEPAAPRLGGRPPGWALTAELTSARGLRAHWRAELRDGANYLHSTLALEAAGVEKPIYGLAWPAIRAPGLHAVGTVPGSPVAGGGWFFGLEMPGARNVLDERGGRTVVDCQLRLAPGTHAEFGAVAGVAPDNQLRRGFLHYLERERARPSQPFLHYNCWYDLGFGVDAAGLLDVAARCHQELELRRGVKVQSYLIDDGWDDPQGGLWREDARKFPGGLAALAKKMAPVGGRLGVWISPLGGYGGAEERREWARNLSLLPKDGEFDLAQPRYREWFQARCLTLMREAGVNAFKWDRAGDGVSPHFMALLEVARALRRENPAVFLNVTVGTWPSPFWLPHVDATWRMGSADVGWAGVGDDRERWLTFRDGNCRRYFVEPAPLYPLNSVMHHGVVQGRQFQGEKVGRAGANLRHEARSYFANGSSLQELYLTPSMMNPAAWDDVAAAARWAATNAPVLADAHWVGGDPLKLEVYGYAAWTPRQGTLMLRNPADRAQRIRLSAAQVFDLPTGAVASFTLRSPYPDQIPAEVSWPAGESLELTLEPFAVWVFDAWPAAR